jgi:hypothetical protein
MSRHVMLNPLLAMGFVLRAQVIVEVGDGQATPPVDNQSQKLVNTTANAP